MSNSNGNNDPNNASGNDSQTPQRPKHQKTQSEQDKDDDKARQDAEEKLVQGWMDRLQLISVITTFFAANEAQLLSITTPSDSPDQSSAVSQTANAMLSGALVLHTFSAVIAFIGAFVLVRYKVKEAKEEEAKEEGKSEKERSQAKDNARKQGQLWSSNPHIEQVGYFMPRRPPGSLLQQTHSIAVITAFSGFVFSIVGMVCYAWSQQARSVSIFSSACVGACLVISLIIIKPFAKAEERS